MQPLSGTAKEWLTQALVTPTATVHHLYPRGSSRISTAYCLCFVQTSSSVHVLLQIYPPQVILTCLRHRRLSRVIHPSSKLFSCKEDGSDSVVKSIFSWKAHCHTALYNTIHSTGDYLIQTQQQLPYALIFIPFDISSPSRDTTLINQPASFTHSWVLVSLQFSPPPRSTFTFSMLSKQIGHTWWESTCLVNCDRSLPSSFECLYNW